MSPESRQDSALDHAYFQALEAAFIRLRGAPLLLSPADWQVAKSWRRDGVPIELAVRVMERIFERQSSAAKRTGIKSLRYFRTAVERSWRRIVEMGGADTEPPDSGPIDVSSRLERLASALDSFQPAGAGPELGTEAVVAAAAAEGLSDRIRALAGSVAEVEEELQALDRELMTRLQGGVDKDALERLTAAVESGLEPLSDRMAPDTRRETLEVLLRQRLRGNTGLPVLSLFSISARSGSPGPSGGTSAETSED